MKTTSVLKRIHRLVAPLVLICTVGTAVAGTCRDSKSVDPAIQARLSALGLCFDGDMMIRLPDALPKGRAACASGSSIDPVWRTQLENSGYCYIGNYVVSMPARDGSGGEGHYSVAIFRPIDGSVKGTGSVAVTQFQVKKDDKVETGHTVLSGGWQSPDGSKNGNAEFVAENADDRFLRIFLQLKESFPDGRPDSGSDGAGKGKGVFGSGVSSEDAAYFVSSLISNVQRASQMAAEREAELQNYHGLITENVDSQNRIFLHWRAQGDRAQAGLGMAIAAASGALNDLASQPGGGGSGVTGGVTGVRIDDALQGQLISSAEAAVRAGELATVARIMDLLMNPALREISEGTSKWIKNFLRGRAYIEGPALSRRSAAGLGLPQDLAYQAMSAGNWIQVSASAQGKLMKLPYRQDWMRAAVYQLRMGIWAGRQNDTEASVYFAKAKGIAQYFAGEIPSLPLGFTETPEGREELVFREGDDLGVAASDRSNGKRALNAALADVGKMGPGGKAEIPAWISDLKSRWYWASVRDAIEAAKMREPAKSPLLQFAAESFLGSIVQGAFGSGSGPVTAKQWERSLDQLELAIGVIDFIMNWSPAAWIRDGYNSVHETDLVTNATLTEFDHCLAVLGVATAGLGSKTKKVTEAIDRTAEALKPIARNGLGEAVRGAKAIAESPLGQAVVNARKSGSAEIAEGTFKALNAHSLLSNPFPKNGVYAKAIEREYAELLKQGSGRLARPGHAEGWIGAAEDMKHVTKSTLARVAALYSDAAATKLKDVSEYVIVEFKFKSAFDPQLYSPIDSYGELRQFGWVPGGKTAGGLREWVVDADAFNNGMIDLDSIVIRELKP